MNIDLSLVGLGLYTPAEAERWTGISARKLTRWMRGHLIDNRGYEPLWLPQIDIGDGRIYLSFLDLIQSRVAAALVEEGLSPQKVRRAIQLGGKVLESDYPFAHARFRTDGKTVILEVLRLGEDDRLIDLFRDGQYVMKRIIEPTLKGIDFEGDVAVRWWPTGKARGVVIDPKRQFGQPIDDATGIPTSVLSQAVGAEGSIEKAAQAYMVPVASVRRAIAFEQRQAA